MLRQEGQTPSAGWYPVRVLACLVAGGLLLQLVGNWLSPEQLRTASLATASLLSSVMGLFTDRVSVDGQMLSFDWFSIRIILECLGLYELVILWAAVLAYPASWRARVWGLLLGPFVVFAINAVRIASLLVFGRYQPELFPYVHIYFWQGSFIAIVVLTWLAWVRVFAHR